MNQEECLQLSNQLLKGDFEIPKESDAELLATQLRSVINFHDQIYYVQSNSIITDYEYDQLFAWLKLIESNYPEFITPNSPTQKVANGLNNDFQTVTHLKPMMSLENSYNAEDLADFEKRITDAIATRNTIQYTVEPKYDGSSIALVYENDIFVRAATRGNGNEGDEITQNAKSIKSIPLKANFSQFGIRKIEVRGEVIINSANFELLLNERNELNKSLKLAGKKTLELFKNPRNTAAGALRMKDPKEVAARKLDAIIYNIGYMEDMDGKEFSHPAFQSQYGNMDKLHDLGFKTPEAERGKFYTIEAAAAFCLSWENQRASFPIEIDGMVVKVDDILQQTIIGKTTHHPKWAIAYKFKAQQAFSILRKIDYQVGRTGAITPVAKIDPVQLAGVEISSISLHNEEFINEKNILLGDTVIIERAGDVIPYIAGALFEKRNGSEINIQFPTQCPSCNHHLVKPIEESIWRCINPNCPAQLEERLIHFGSKNCMEITGLGEEIVKKFVAEKIIQNFTDIFDLDYEKIRKLEGWKDKSVENLKQSISQAKQQPLWRLIAALGIRHVGTNTAKQLEKQVQKLQDLQDWEIEKLTELEDIGPKVAQSIFEFFNDEENIQLLNKLEELGVNLSNISSSLKLSALLEGKTFLFTGTLNKMSRDDAKELVEKHGGKNLSGISANLHYLIAGEKAGGKLTKAQKIPSIQIIDEDTFLNMIKD
jgi:DNA ligase (NAD+)